MTSNFMLHALTEIATLEYVYIDIPTKYKHTSTIIIIIMQNHKSFTHLTALSYQSACTVFWNRNKIMQ